MSKRKMSENSLKNLKPFTSVDEKSRERARQCQKNGNEKKKQYKAEKIARENSKDWTWDKYGQELIEDIVQNGSTKDKVELIKALFPNDKQVNELSGGVEVQMIFVTPEMHEATMKHIQEVINDGQEEYRDYFQNESS